MKFHKEGYPTLLVAITFIAILLILAHYFAYPNTILRYLAYGISIFIMLTVLQFFRSPKRPHSKNESAVICPADGKVVVIEQVEETEFYKDKRVQISIFMSPVDVHINRFPISGTVKYVKYHPGKYLVAWHPKSSTKNERSSIVIEKPGGESLLIRQIAGALARRIVYYCKEGEHVIQGEELGFIKFGSRVDVFLPLTAEIHVSLNQKVKGGETVLGVLK